MDITAFHPDQRDWSSSRPHRPPILSLWSEPPRSAPTYHLGYLLFNGRLILDYAGNPIKAFRHLPLTISSAVGGFRIETWSRQDIHRLRIDDILARLRTRTTPNGQEPLQRGGNLYNRSNNFRLKSGLIDFRNRNDVARTAARAYLDSLRTPAQRANNQALDRDLTAEEFDTLKDLGRKGRLDAAAGPSANPSPRTPVPTPVLRVATARKPRAAHHPHRSSTPEPTPATPLIQAPVQNLPDSRDDVPKTLKEIYHINDAISETVQHFIRLTAQNPKRPDTHHSYTSRWNALQAEFAPIWKSQRPELEMPSLFKLPKWTGGVARWEDDWRTKLGGVEKCKTDKQFLEYMDATAEGRAYVGRHETWVSVRDKWCNSHRGRVEEAMVEIESPSEKEEEEEE